MWSEGALAFARSSGEGVSVIARMFEEVVARCNSGVGWRLDCNCGYYDCWAEWMGSGL